MNGLSRKATGKLVKDVDEILIWKKSFDMKQAEMIRWMASVDQRIEALQKDLETTLKGCNILMETDTALGQQIDNQKERINIVNKRLRKIENAVKHARIEL